MEANSEVTHKTADKWASGVPRDFNRNYLPGENKNVPDEAVAKIVRSPKILRFAE